MQEPEETTEYVPTRHAAVETFVTFPVLDVLLKPALESAVSTSGTKGAALMEDCKPVTLKLTLSLCPLQAPRTTSRAKQQSGSCIIHTCHGEP